MSLSIDSLEYRHSDTIILSGIDLHIKPGEVVATIGPSGTGKTTLLRLIALFERPTAGQLLIDDVDPWSVSERRRLTIRRRISMVFQQSSLFDASIGRNVTYGIRVRRPWTPRVRSIADEFLGQTSLPDAAREALDLVGMSDQPDRPISELSGGEAQRVAFARAIAVEPDMLLLDEPTSDLDPRNTAAIETAIRAARDRGIAVIIATHDMHQAKRVADRVVVILNGTIIETGATERIFSEPGDPRTAKFINGELVY